MPSPVPAPRSAQNGSTPLAVLRGELELALSAGRAEEVRHSLHAALGETDRLSRLAEDLLPARARAGSPAATTPAPPGGAGLGLSIVHAVVTAHRAAGNPSPPDLPGSA